MIFFSSGAVLLYATPLQIWIVLDKVSHSNRHCVHSLCSHIWWNTMWHNNTGDAGFTAGHVSISLAKWSWKKCKSQWRTLNLFFCSLLPAIKCFNAVFLTQQAMDSVLVIHYTFRSTAKHNFDKFAWIVDNF